jgi:putative aldouronate transport system substrate-binding protein
MTHIQTHDRSTDMKASPSLSRRALFAGGAATGVTALAGGCSNEGRGGVAADQANLPVTPPTFTQFKGVEPDLMGDPETGLQDAFFHYPADPPRTIMEPPGDGKKISAVTMTYSPVPPRLGRNTFWQNLNEKLGSDLDINTVPSDQYGQKFATIIAGDALPDLFFVSAIPQLPQFLDAAAVDLTPYLSGDAVNDYPFIANIPAECWQQVSLNGKIMGIPIHRGRQTTFAFAQRADLLRDKGITEDPANFEEFRDLCKELTDEKNNVWPLGGPPVDFLRQMLGLGVDWEYTDGNLTTTKDDERNEQALAACVELLDAGVMNPDSFANPDGKAWFGAGKTYYAWEWMSSWEQYFREQTSGDAFEMSALLPPPFEDGSEPVTWLGGANFGYSAVSQNVGDRVVTALAVINYLSAPFGTQEQLDVKYGVEGRHYTLDGTDPVPTAAGTSQSGLGQGYLADGPRTLYNIGDEKASRATYEAMKKVIAPGVPDPTQDLYSETKSRLWDIINGNLGNVQNDILQKRKPVSAWKDAVEDWKRTGGEQIRVELEEALASTQA